MMTQEKLTLDVIQALIGSELGVARPYVAPASYSVRHSHLQGEIPSLEDHLHTLFKVVHVGPVATGIQSLMLLYQIMESKQAVYYQALYTKLLDPALRNLSGQSTNCAFKPHSEV
ncbi:hypothetical protein EMCRGX_G032701 [Ephydatia muelleri]